MFDFFSQLLDQQGFMPHGHCYLWRDEVLWLHLIGDGLTVLAYFLIPGMLLYFVRVRHDIRYRTIFYLFGLFIVTCGTSHLISMFTIWEPIYRLESLVKMLTGVVSISTTAYMLVLMPKARRIPTIEQLQAVNARLEEEIAQHKATAEELRASQSQLQQQVQAVEEINQELESFVYSVAHDLRAPLRHVIGYAELMEEPRQDRTEEEDAFYMQKISRSARHMGHLIDGLLDFSRGRNQPLQIQAVALQELIPKLQEQLSQENPDRQVEWKIGTLPTVQGDPVMLEQVFANLLSNAIKFTQHAVVARIAVTAETLPGAYAVTVTDNGAGFDMEYEEKLYSLFERLHRQKEFPGHGVGLATAKRIVERHGGSIEAHGKIDQGASFRIILPQEPVENVGPMS